MNINLTLFGQMVTFAIFVWFCMKFIWPILLAQFQYVVILLVPGTSVLL